MRLPPRSVRAPPGCIAHGALAAWRRALQAACKTCSKPNLKAWLELTEHLYMYRYRYGLLVCFVLGHGWGMDAAPGTWLPHTSSLATHSIIQGALRPLPTKFITFLATMSTAQRDSASDHTRRPSSINALTIHVLVLKFYSINSSIDSN